MALRNSTYCQIWAFTFGTLDPDLRSPNDFRMPGVEIWRYAVPMTFGEYLRQAMINAGFPSDVSLANATGVSRSAISKWRNDIEPPRIPALRLIAPALNIPLLTLMAAAKLITPEEAGLEGEPTPPEPLDIAELVAKTDLTAEEKKAVADELRRLRGLHTTPRKPKKNQDTDEIETRRRA